MTRNDKGLDKKLCCMLCKEGPDHSDVYNANMQDRPGFEVKMKKLRCFVLFCFVLFCYK